MPFAPRLESTRGGLSMTGAELLDVADRHRGGDEQRGVRGQPLHRAARRRAARRAASPSSAAIVSPASASAARHASSHPGLDVAAAIRLGGGRCGAACRPRAAGSCHALYGSNAICAASGSAGQPAAQRLGGRQIADPEHEPGAVGVGERRVAQQQVVVGDRRSAAPGAGQRVGKDRDADAGGERGQPRWIRGVPAPATISRRPEGCGPGPLAGRGGPGGSTITYGCPSPRAVESGGSGSSTTSGSRRGKLRCTGPGRPSSAVQ